MMMFEVGNMHSSNGNLNLIDVVYLFEKQSTMGNGINLCLVLHWNLNW
jgi:hypothetical protein